MYGFLSYAYLLFFFLILPVKNLSKLAMCLFDFKQKSIYIEVIKVSSYAGKASSVKLYFGGTMSTNVFILFIFFYYSLPLLSVCKCTSIYFFTIFSSSQIFSESIEKYSLLTLIIFRLFPNTIFVVFKSFFKSAT